MLQPQPAQRRDPFIQPYLLVFPFRELATDLSEPILKVGFFLENKRNT
jgi:hypothetical protein